MKKNINGMPFDFEQLFTESEVITATDASIGIVDLKGLGFGKGSLVIDAVALDLADADETYVFKLELSETLAFTVAVEALTRDILAVGRDIVPINNQIAGTMYRYARLSAVLAGTTPSITLTSFISEEVI